MLPFGPRFLALSLFVSSSRRDATRLPRVISEMGRASSDVVEAPLGLMEETTPSNFLQGVGQLHRRRRALVSLLKRRLQLHHVRL